MSEQQSTQKGQNLADLTEDESRAYLESLLWPDGPICSHCESTDVYRMEGASVRPGLLRCRACKKQFSVLLGTIFSDSHVPLRLWVRAFHLMCSSKKGISSLQLQRNLGLGSYRTAWHMTHRIRTAMECKPFAEKLRGTVQVDETHIGAPLAGKGRGNYSANKITVVTLASEDGPKRSVVLEGKPTAQAVQKAVTDNLAPGSVLVVDGGTAYIPLGRDYELHRVSKQKGRHVSVEADGRRFHTNGVESSFALLKRGIYGTFHHISRKHAHRYCAEFDYRWSERKTKDVPRTVKALKQVKGKRLMIKALMKD